MEGTEKLKAMGRRIASARVRLGIKQVALAQTIGVSTSSLTNWENGRFVPSPSRLYRLAAALQVPVSWLLGDGFGESPALEADFASLPDPESRVREAKEPYGGLTTADRVVVNCPHCGKELEIRRRP